MARDRRSRVVEFLRIDAPSNHRLTIGRGALGPAVAILAVMIFTLAGLVIDGGRQLGAGPARSATPRRRPASARPPSS